MMLINETYQHGLLAGLGRRLDSAQESWLLLDDLGKHVVKRPELAMINITNPINQATDQHVCVNGHERKAPADEPE
jgi:hypothetical protein